MTARKTETLSQRQVRRLALARAGLLKPEWTDLPRRAQGRGRRARRAAHEVIRRFGYLQLDSIPVSGARTHGIVLHSRLEGFDPGFAEDLLAPGEPLFEYWGHEACWLPIELYPVFAFRRREFKVHPWWGDLIGENPRLVRLVLERVRGEGALRSLDLEHLDGDRSLLRKVVSALWSSGDLAVRERRFFHRFFDLAERVIPEDLLGRSLPDDEALGVLLMKALDGHGWATAGTLAATWRLRNHWRQALVRATDELVEAGEVVPCTFQGDDGQKRQGFVRPADLELAGRLEGVRPRRDRGVLLSPFDPVLWDRERVRQLFGFDQVIEIYKPAPERRYGYYCLPVLAGEELVARVDLKADRGAGVVRLLAHHDEEGTKASAAESRAAVASALGRFTEALGLGLEGAPR